MSYETNRGDIRTVACRTCVAGPGESCTSGRSAASQPHAARRADFRAFNRDIEADLEALDARKRQALTLAQHGLKNQRCWSARPPGGKFQRLASSVVEELERWGALERTQGHGNSLGLSPYGERMLARVET